jgi:unsaturated rhamnogalacturonyl hydrolase
MKKITLFLSLCTIAIMSTNAQKNDTIDWPQQTSNYMKARWDTVKDYKKWTYDVALLARAIYTANPAANYAFLKKHVDQFIMPDGSINGYSKDKYNIDLVQPGRDLFVLYDSTHDAKYLKAIETLVSQMKTHPKVAEGGYWHKKTYPNQMWLDGIYMGSPFLTQYAKKFNQPEWFDVVALQITLIYKHTLDPKTGLLYHAWDASKKERWANPVTGQSPNFWSRSIGWYEMAIVDVLDYLPENHPSRPAIIECLQNVSAALLKFQDPKTGLWYQVTDRGPEGGNYLEASGSAMFAYAFAKGAKKGYLSPEYKEYAQKAYNGLINYLMVKNANGQYDLTQTVGGCGLGGKPYRDGSFEYYVTEKIVTNDTKGVGPFILAGIELKK